MQSGKRLYPNKQEHGDKQEKAGGITPLGNTTFDWLNQILVGKFINLRWDLSDYSALNRLNSNFIPIFAFLTLLYYGYDPPVLVTESLLYAQNSNSHECIWFQYWDKRSS